MADLTADTIARLRAHALEGVSCVVARSELTALLDAWESLQEESRNVDRLHEQVQAIGKECDAARAEVDDLRLTLGLAEEHGFHTRATRELAAALGMRDGKHTADRVADAARAEVERLREALANIRNEECVDCRSERIACTALEQTARLSHVCGECDRLRNMLESVRRAEGGCVYGGGGGDPDGRFCKDVSVWDRENPCSYCIATAALESK